MDTLDWNRHETIWQGLHRPGETLAPAHAQQLREDLRVWWNVALCDNVTLARVAADVRQRMVSADSNEAARETISEALGALEPSERDELARFLFRARAVVRPWEHADVVDALLVGPANSYWNLTPRVARVSQAAA